MGSNQPHLKMLRWAHLPECEHPPSGWRVCSFTDVATVVAGQSPPSETYNGKELGLPFLQGNGDFMDKHPRPTTWSSDAPKIASDGDILISVRAPVGEMNLADQRYAIGRGLAAIRAKDAQQEFLYHGLQRWRWCLQRVAQGTTFDAVTARHFGQLFIALPDVAEEQAAIARVLNSVDSAIEYSVAAVMAATELYHSLLNECLTSGLGSDGLVRDRTTRPDDFQRTSMGWLPCAWKPSDIRAEFEIQNGITLNEARRERLPKWRYLRVANVQRDQLSLDDVKVLEAKDTEVAPRLLAANDLLVVEGHADRMQIGRCALVTADAVGMTFQNHLFRLRSKGRLLPEFACLWLNSSHAQRYWNAMCATSSGLNTINQKMLKRLNIPVLDTDEQKRIASLLGASKSRIAALEAKVAALRGLKKSLLHDLLTGAKRLDPKRILEAAQE